jgi:hypothetical protein
MKSPFRYVSRKLAELDAAMRAKQSLAPQGEPVSNVQVLIARYLRERLIPLLGLSQIQLHDHRKGFSLVLSAESRRGDVAIKVFSATRPRNSVKTEFWLSRHSELPVPKPILIDTEPSVSEEYGITAFVTPWYAMRGRGVNAHPRLRMALLAQLAELHERDFTLEARRPRTEGALEAGDESGGPKIETVRGVLAPGMAFTPESVLRRSMRNLDRRLRPHLTKEDRRAFPEIKRALGIAIGRVFDACPRPSLVHGDLNGSNLFADADGKIVMIDYGSSGFGPFALEIPPVFMRLADSDRLPYPLDRDGSILPPTNLDMLENEYFKRRAAESRTSWMNCREDAFVHGYLVMLGRYAAMSHKQRLSEPLREHCFEEAVRQRWRGFVDYVLARYS